MVYASLMGCICAAVCGLASAAYGQTLPRFDLTRADAVSQWHASHDISSLTASPQGMRIAISGADPYTMGPARDYPAGTPLWLHIKLRSEQGGSGQVFYYGPVDGPTEAKSVRFPVRQNVWEEIRTPLPALGSGYHLRIDPPGDDGACLIASLSFEPRITLKTPNWPRPVPPAIGHNSLHIRSGDLSVWQSPGQIEGIGIDVAGNRMAVGNTRPLIGYMTPAGLRWLDLGTTGKQTAHMHGGGISVEITARDRDGATWTIDRSFTPGRRAGAISVTTSVRVDKRRDVVYLPMLVLLPGIGSFGETKHQALFAGLEYLDGSEPSSSEADIIGPGSHRQVPDSLRITFPLMVINADDRYVGLIWEPAGQWSALFDSPDRQFHAGGHLMGVLFPGSDGNNRVEGSLLPYAGRELRPGAAITLHAAIIGGRGSDVVPAVQQYTALRGLPAVPATGMPFAAYADWAAHAWLDSGSREGARYRHAISPGGTFAPQPAADAAVAMLRLAPHTEDADLRARLKRTAADAISAVPSSEINSAAVGHVRYPDASLVFGHIAEAADHARDAGRGLLTRFSPDGSIPYRHAPNSSDLGRTHFAPDADGLTGQVVDQLLTEACASGDMALVHEALAKLHDLDRFRGKAPRGAQTWEVPLHTPDILASAYLARAYTRGYELTGDKHLLDAARYWAWTGVPFVYLTNPAGHPVGPYATTAVYGATQWVAPNWMGLPVQWCGLVYADALYWLAVHDSSGPWLRLADGITASAIQQSYPVGSDRLTGLLPDSFNLREQTRNYPAINPGSLFADALRMYRKAPIYDFQVFRSSGLLVHAPGKITHVRDDSGSAVLHVEGWPEEAYHVLVCGLRAAPRSIFINGHALDRKTEAVWDTSRHLLTVNMHGAGTLEIHK